MHIFYVYLIPLFLSACASLIAIRLAWPRPYRMFSVFLWITLFVELGAFFWSSRLHAVFGAEYSSNNIWIYNAYLIPQYVFYVYFFRANTTSVSIRRVSIVSGGIYVLLVLWSFLYFKRLFVVDGATIMASSFLVLFLTTAYFIRLMQSTEIIQLQRQPLFWIAVGCFIFHLGSLPCFILYRFVSGAQSALATSLFRIIVFLNCVLYSLYTIAFLCTKKYPTQPS